MTVMIVIDVGIETAAIRHQQGERRTSLFRSSQLLVSPNKGQYRCCQPQAHKLVQKLLVAEAYLRAPTSLLALHPICSTSTLQHRLLLQQLLQGGWTYWIWHQQHQQ